MNEQELRQLYDRYTPNVPFEQFAQDMQDPDYRSEFLKYTMSQLVGRGGQPSTPQQEQQGPQPFKLQVPSVIQQAAPKQPTQEPAQQPVQEPVQDPFAQQETQVPYRPDYMQESAPEEEVPMIGARPKPTPFLTGQEIEQKYEKPPVREEFDFAKATSSPMLLTAELNRLKNAPISEEPTPAVGIAKKVTEAEDLYARAVKEKTNLIKYKYKNFIQSRWEEYAGAIQSEADKKIIIETIQKEGDFFLKNETEKLQSEVQPFYDTYAEIYNSDINQMAMKNPTMANAYYKERAQAYSDMGTGERTLRNALMLPAFSSLQSTIADVIPGMWAAAQAANEGDTYEQALASKYMRENRLNYGLARQRMTPGQQMEDQAQWQQRMGKTAVDEEINRVGREQFELDKKEFQKAQAARRALKLEYAYQQQGEAAGKMSAFAPTWQEVSGPLGISEYVQRNIAQAVGFSIPTVLGSMAAGPVGGFAAGQAMMYGVEAGSAYLESIDALREKFPKLSTEEILRQNIDEPYRDAAVRTGIINAALEQVSNLTILGKFIPKGSVVKFIDTFVKSRVGKITLGTTVEASTEWVQKKDQRYQQYLADGMSHHDALEKALAQDDTEELIAGGVGGGGMSTIASFFNTKKKATADAIVSNVSTGNPELDNQIDSEARNAQLINRQKGDLPNVKEGQEGVSGVVQQGQAPVQEGTQPQVSGTETAAGGVLQVSPETPGEATVTPAPFEIKRAEPRVTEETRTPKQGDIATVPPAITGGMERTFEFDNGEWKQKVGGELVSVPGLQSQVNTEFRKQAGQQLTTPLQVQAVTPVGKTTDLVAEGEKELSDVLGIQPETQPVVTQQPVTEQVTPQPITVTPQPVTTQTEGKTPVTETPNTVYFVDGQTGQVQQGTVTKKNDKAVTINVNGKNVYLQPNEIFTTEQEAKDYATSVAPTTTQAATDSKRIKELSDENTIRDQEGNPIVYYHGTTKEAADSIRKNGFDLTKGRFGESTGISLTKNKNQAYTDKGDTIKTIVSLKNPMSYAMNFQIRNEIAKKITGKTIDKFSVAEWNKYESAIEKEFSKEAKRLGYDGVYDKNQNEVLIFDPKSIKIIDQSSTTTQRTGNLNDFKKYFFNKDPKAFGNQLGTALSMTQDGWKQAYKKFSKNATPEEMQMLQALIGGKVETKTQTTQETEEEVGPMLNKQGLLDAGYTEDQIAMIVNNPETYAQVDNKIVNMETMEVIPAKGSKKVTTKRRRKPVVTEEKIEKTTFKDLQAAMQDPNVKIDTLLRIVAGMGNSYSPLAKAVLQIYKQDRTLKLFKFSTTKGQEKKAWGLADPDRITISVFTEKINKYYREQGYKEKKSEKEILKDIEDATSRVFLHEVVHGFTLRTLYNAIPEVARKGRQQKALDAYLKHGDNQAVKDLIKLFNEALRVTKQRKKEGQQGEYADTRAYGFKDITEFLTEAFTRPEFQIVLNSINSPITTGKSMWQSFVDAVSNILKSTFGPSLKNQPQWAKDVLGSVRPGSILESVIRITPELTTAREEQQTAEETAPRASMSPESQRTETALVKIAKGLIQSGQATAGNILQVLNDKYGTSTKFNLNINDYADAILEEVTPEVQAGEFDAESSVTEFTNSPYSQFTATSVNRKDIEEKVADFLRGKVSDKEQVVDFAAAWNDTLTVDPATGRVDNTKKFLSGDINRIWNRLKDTKGVVSIPGKSKVTENLKEEFDNTKRKEKVATIAQVIEAQWNARAKGKAEGVRWTVKEFRNNLLKAVQEAIANSPVSKAQVQSMLSAVKRVNFFTPGSISKLKQRIDKIQADAEYAQKIRDAKSNKRKISELAKSKTALPNHVSTAEGLKFVDIDYLENDNLDEYLAKTTALLNATRGVLDQRYQPTELYDIQEYINRQIAFKEREQLKELGVPEEKIQNVIDGIDILDLEELAGTELSQTKLLLLEKAEELQEALNNPSTIEDLDGLYVDFKSEEFNLMKNANLYELNATQLSKYIRVADNIIHNGDNSSLGEIASVIGANQSVNELQKEIGEVKRFDISKVMQNIGVGRSVEQMTQIIDSIFRNRKYTAAAYDLSGIYRYFASTAKRENRVNDTLQNIQKFIEKTDSKYGGKPSLTKQGEQAKLTILAELAKYAVDSAEHIEQVHANIKNSIDRIREEDAKFADEIQAAYDKYKGVKTAEEAVDLFKKNDPHVHELWKYLTTEVYSEAFTQEMESNTKSVHGKTFLSFINYLPTALRRVGKDPTKDDAIQPKAGLNARPAKSTIAATRKMNTDQAYDFANFIGRMQSSLQSAVHDVETSKHYQFVTEVLKNPKIKEIFGNVTNLNALIHNIKSTETIQSNMGFENAVMQQVLNTVGNTFATVGAATALGGLDQVFLQYPTAAISGIAVLGRDANLFFAAPNGIIGNQEMREHIKKMLSDQDISVRGKLQQFDLGSKSLSVDDKNKLIKAVKGFGNLNVKAQQSMLKPLLYSDMSIAERLYVAFYLKSLKDQGINVASKDLNKEYEVRNEASRKRAYAYASMMVNDLLVSSTTAGRAEAIQTPGTEAFLRRMLFPFVSFPLNTRVRLLHSIRKTAYNPKEGIKELTAAMSEIVVFNGVRVLLLPAYYAAAKAGVEAAFGFEPPEDEGKERDRLKQWYTQILLDLIPFNLGSGSYLARELVNFVNYEISETDARTLNEFIKKKEEQEPVFEKLPDFSQYNQYWGWGTYGIGVDRITDAWSGTANLFRDDIMVLNEGELYETIVTNEQGEYDKLIWFNLFNQLAPLPREIRSSGNKIYREQLKKTRKEQKIEQKRLGPPTNTSIIFPQ